MSSHRRQLNVLCRYFQGHQLMSDHVRVMIEILSLVGQYLPILGAGSVLDDMISEDHIIQYIIPAASEYQEIQCGEYLQY